MFNFAPSRHCAFALNLFCFYPAATGDPADPVTFLLSWNVMRPIVDLHCDLLCYLAKNPSHSIHNPEVRCSLPQLLAGNVKFQTLAVFTETKAHSTIDGQNQILQFSSLPSNFQRLDRSTIQSFDLLSPPIKVALSIENASGLFEENEPLENGFKRIENTENHVGKIIYISLTWNLENRFGGGAHTRVGLKNDGKALLDFLNAKQIALDLSHASDLLAYEALDYIHAKDLKIPVLASHSNYRAVVDVPRNLPDDIALEIIRRKGLIGFVFCRQFVGTDHVKNFVRQIEHAFHLGAEKNCCFGADFFFGGDLPPPFAKPDDQLFFPEFADASTYGKLMDLWKKEFRAFRSAIG